MTATFTLADSNIYVTNKKPHKISLIRKLEIANLIGFNWFFKPNLLAREAEENPPKFEQSTFK